MKKVFKYAGIILLGLIGWSIILSSGKTENASTEKNESSVTSKDSSEIKFASLNSKMAEANKARAAEAQKTFVRLKSKFHIKKDEFKNTTFYRHKTFTESYPDRKTLSVGLNESGYIYLMSNYHGTDWLFHEKVLVKIGDNNPVSTPTVPTYSESHATYNSAGTVWEQNIYEDQEPLIQMIALNIDQKITLRFEGRQHYSDVVLSKNDKQAIKDSWELAAALSSLAEPN